MRSRAKAILAFLVLFPADALAQHISIDGRFSPAQTLQGPNYWIAARLGKQVGGNLFQSFGQFGLSNGESATFFGPPKINNVIGRVTGGNVSSIDGKIKSDIRGANLYLINPNGIVFGPNAKINVSGSFYASTADYLKMSDGAKFQATNPDASTLSAARPAAFGFATPRPVAITINGSTLAVGTREKKEDYSAASGHIGDARDYLRDASPTSRRISRTLGIIAGPVAINSANLSASGGTIHVASAASTGEVPVDPRNSPTITSFGTVAINRSSLLDVSSTHNAGSVFVRAGTLTVDSSEINADSSTLGGQIVLVNNQLSVTNGSFVHAEGLGSGHGGSVSINAGSVDINAKSVLNVSGIGNAGGVSINAGALTIDAGEINADSNTLGGQIVLVNNQLSVSNGSYVHAESYGLGRGGSVTINSGNIDLDRAVIDTDTHGSGNAGNLAVNAGSISISNGGEFSSSTYSSGSGGNIAINLTGDLQIHNGLNPAFVTGILGTAFGSGKGGSVAVNVDGHIVLNGGSGVAEIGADSFGSGTGGNVAVNAGSISVANGGEISSNAFKTGNAGTVDVNASGLLSVDGGTKGIAVISTDSLAAQGNAGSTRINAGNLFITSGGEISSDAAFGTGRAGSVAINVAGTLTLDGGSTGIALISAFSALSKGNSGDLTVKASDAVVRNGGEISTTALGTQGNAGNILIDVSGNLTIDGGAIVSSTGALPGIESTGNAGNVSVSAGSLEVTNKGIISANTATSGEAGIVTVSTGSLSISNDGAIVSNTFGAGNGGSVFVTADHLMISGASNGLLTGIAANAETGQTGNAGNVVVRAGDLTILHNGEIAGNTFGTGNGGNVSVDVTGPLMIDGSAANQAFITGIDTQANQQSSGNSGRLTISAGSLTIVNGGQISDRTLGTGNGGNLNVNVTGNDPQINIGSITLSTNSGNITLHVADFLHLIDGVISTSVNGQAGNGNGGNVPPQLMVIEPSTIIAPQAPQPPQPPQPPQAVEGQGSNITMTANMVPSSNSIPATSQTEIPSAISINGLVIPDGAYVVLTTQLLDRTRVLQRSCAARANRSTLVEGSQRVSPHDPDVTLPALYIAGRDLKIQNASTPAKRQPITAQQTAIHLTIHCG